MPSPRALACTCCGEWRIRQVTLEHGQPRLRAEHGPNWLADCRDVAEVERVLARFGGPDLSQFQECP